MSLQSVAMQESIDTHIMPALSCKRHTLRTCLSPLDSPGGRQAVPLAVKTGWKPCGTRQICTVLLSVLAVVAVTLNCFRISYGLRDRSNLSRRLAGREPTGEDDPKLWEILKACWGVEDEAGGAHLPQAELEPNTSWQSMQPHQEQQAISISPSLLPWGPSTQALPHIPEPSTDPPTQRSDILPFTSAGAPEAADLLVQADPTSSWGPLTQQTSGGGPVNAVAQGYIAPSSRCASGASSQLNHPQEAGPFAPPGAAGANALPGSVAPVSAREKRPLEEGEGRISHVEGAAHKVVKGQTALEGGPHLSGAGMPVSAGSGGLTSLQGQSSSACAYGTQLGGAPAGNLQGAIFSSIAPYGGASGEGSSSGGSFQQKHSNAEMPWVAQPAHILPGLQAEAFRAFGSLPASPSTLGVLPQLDCVTFYQRQSSPQLLQDQQTSTVTQTLPAAQPAGQRPPLCHPNPQHRPTLQPGDQRPSWLFPVYEAADASLQGLSVSSWASPMLPPAGGGPITAVAKGCASSTPRCAGDASSQFKHLQEAASFALPGAAGAHAPSGTVPSASSWASPMLPPSGGGRVSAVAQGYIIPSSRCASGASSQLNHPQEVGPFAPPGAAGANALPGSVAPVSAREKRPLEEGEGRISHVEGAAHKVVKDQTALEGGPHLSGAGMPVSAGSGGLSSDEGERSSACASETHLGDAPVEGQGTSSSSTVHRGGAFRNSSASGSPFASSSAGTAVHLLNHPFNRLPTLLLEEGASVRRFSPAKAFAPWRVAHAPNTALEHMCRHFAKRTLCATEGDAIVVWAQRVVGHLFHRHQTPVVGVTPADAVDVLGRRYLMLDSLVCAIQVLGPAMRAATWWDKLVSVIPADVVLADRSFPYQRSQHYTALAKRLSAAIKVLKSGVRPDAGETVSLKRELFGINSTHPEFRRARWDAWRRQDKEARGRREDSTRD
ncbi:hypothetical protein, conserved [Eimeria praecox]|uniref:Transmembrane protein n=1 Tax=Eimeria praecox TaxID=51316 RepID=U6H3G3_9EIME|nr:hypothetical protein, conserved [Eimeria praecox]